MLSWTSRRFAVKLLRSRLTSALSWLSSCCPALSRCRIPKWSSCGFPKPRGAQARSIVVRPRDIPPTKCVSKPVPFFVELLFFRGCSRGAPGACRVLRGTKGRLGDSLSLCFRSSNRASVRTSGTIPCGAYCGYSPHQGSRLSVQCSLSRCGRRGRSARAGASLAASGVLDRSALKFLGDCLSRENLA